MATRLDTIEGSIRTQLHGVRRIETGHWDEVMVAYILVGRGWVHRGSLGS